MLFGAVLFWLPALASASLMLLLAGGIGAHPRFVPACFTLAVLVQFFCAVNSPAWTAGIIVQTFLAIYLAARMKLQG